MKEKPTVEIHNKVLLNLDEASAYSGIGKTTLYNRINSSHYDFVFKVNSKYLIKRKLFEEFLLNSDGI